jgi:rhodanese-related sulfurtransferase
MAGPLDELLAAAAARIARLEPRAAYAAVEAGACLVDIRSRDSRDRHGVVPGSLHVPRTVLEWRLEPGGRWRSPHAPSTDARVLVLCDGGFSSVFAAAQLVAIGYERAGDVVGGFAAWRAAGLPWRVATDVPPAPDELPGMRPPE